MNVEDIKGTDKVFRIKIEALENRCRELESIIDKLNMSGNNNDKIR